MFDLQFKLEETVDCIDKVIASMGETAEQMNIKIHEMRNMDGTWTVTPMLLARAQALSALARIREGGQ